jgi:hypothetical protein
MPSKLDYKNEDLIAVLPETFEKVQYQLIADASRWGDTWKHRDIGGQDARIAEHIQDYLDQFRNARVPIPYLKIVGLCHIALTRQAHPELLIDKKT